MRRNAAGWLVKLLAMQRELNAEQYPNTTVKARLSWSVPYRFCSLCTAGTPPDALTVSGALRDEGHFLLPGVPDVLLLNISLEISPRQTGRHVPEILLRSGRPYR
jgi:hypothetical protein